MKKTPVILDPLELSQLNKDFDWVQSRVFMGNNSAFLSSILCNMDMVWTRDIPTAQTNGKVLWWNPDFFRKKHAKDPRINVTILKHELWHPASLHMLRRGTRDAYVWNIACDIRINNDLRDAGEYMGGFRYWLDASYGRDVAEEDIYEELWAACQASGQTPASPWQDDEDIDHDIPMDDSSGDMDDDDLTDMDHRDIINNVVISKTIAEQQGQWTPGNLDEILNQFLAPVLPWEQLIQRWCQDLIESRHTWRRPSRRHRHIYMPSRAESSGRLDHLIYFLDVSESCGNGDVVRFNSEIYYIKTIFNPKKLTLVQFHDKICDVRVITEEEDFKEITRRGRGGTKWSCVKEFLEQTKDATAAIVFTDMGFEENYYHGELEKPLGDIPILFAAVNYNGSEEPPFPGSRLIRIQC